ncbi:MULTISPECIES: type I polyketide synthase [unclassified Bradyrhizobium]|uniref:type I polyketide synthase n=4 Tax=unclassified Bradyrhizobium TaxID=2631580 RepID=UPI0028EC2419|nr:MULTISPECIES: type I polyketide synthase [unclassified Bradyrhizobium]
MSWQRDALVAIEKLKVRARQVEYEQNEPIAIVGMACRLPGSECPDRLWRALDDGSDPIASVPWEGPAMSCGLVDTITEFDAGFFRVSPGEAQRMDPRQRLLLEVTWEALEHAGISAQSLEEERVGVYVGASGNGYAAHLYRSDVEADGYDVTGSLASVIAGRVSYFLGLRGPAMTIDTACSSSLVAVHVAMKALRARECAVALAGGVAAVPRMSRETESWLALSHFSKHGRCRPFDASADGIVSSDGCGMVVLKRLSTAKQDGDRILAVIRGSAINHDGRTQGLTVPSGLAQEDLIRRALEEARVRPKEVGYVECHGTGTVLGDPIEVQALGSVLSEGREADRPVIVGSVKSNLGHTDAAAGVAGLIKVVLSLQHGRIPKNLHFEAPNPHIAWDELPVKVASEAVPWVRNGVARIAGVSSFGISGTNAHVVVEEAPAAAETALSAAKRSCELLVLSAKSGEALEASAARLAEHVKARAEQTLGDIAYSLATTRSHHEHRLALAVATREELVSGLEAVSRGEPAVGLVRGEVRRRGKTAWLFTGQGSQHVGMGRGLYEEWPAFREALDAAWAALDPHLERPLREVMWSDPSQAARLDETGWTQPALFALEVALAALWRSWGAEPDVVAGHSIGEVAAAHVAGVFSLTDAARLVAARGRLMQALPRGGAMVSIAASEAEVAKAVAAQAGGVSIAAVNSASSVVISGEEEAVFAVSSAFAAKGTRTHRLRVSHAFHSALMDPMLEQFRRVAEQLTYRPAQIGVVSNVSGKLADCELSSAAYWVKHVREGVRFADGVAALHAAGVTEYLELGPRPTLLGLVPACLPAGAKEPALVASLRPERAEPAAALQALGAHYAQGGQLEWKGVFPSGGARVELPTYPWQRQRYWMAASASRSGGEPTGHPLLGTRLPIAGTGAVYETVLSRAEQSWLYDHRVGGQALMPGTGVVELVRAAGEHCFAAPVEVLSLVLQSPLMLPEDGGQRVQAVVKEDEDGAEVSIYSQRSGSTEVAEWTLHASGEVRRARGEAGKRLDLAALRSRCSESVQIEQAYEEFASARLNYGAAFQGLRRLWRGVDEALAEVSLPESVDGAEHFGVHPALLDAAFQSLLSGIVGQQGPHLPFAIERVIVHAPGASAAWVHVRRRTGESGEEGIAAEVTLADERGHVLVEVIGLRSRPAATEALQRSEGVAKSLYRFDWSASPPPAAASRSGRWIVVAPESDEASAVVERLQRAGAVCERVDIAGLAAALPADHVVCLWRGVPVEAAAAQVQRLASEGLSVVQLVTKQARAPRLWWVTRGAIATVGEEAAEVSQASLWGLGRTVMQEHPELGCTLIDVEDTASAETIVRALCADDEERQIAWRGGERRVARLMSAAGASVPDGENYTLAIKRKGTLEGLALVPASRRRAGRGEVEIEVRASGLNFRDVLNALGMYPGEAGLLGSECAGVVTAVGEGVEAIAPGDCVMAFAPGSFGRYVIADARLVARVPDDLSLQQAATIPIAFLTAWYALHDLAGLKAGERLLVHAAAGGVGMAAVQIARWIGAEVYGTASPAKWEVVRSLGVKAVARSRDLSFVEAIRSAAGGANVDVVLNALSGEFVDASLSLVGPGGRFIELGKTDIREATAVAASHPGVRYQAFDLVDASVERLAEMFASIAEGFASGHLTAPPVRSFAITDAEAAFRFMAQARHVGKLALVPPRSPRTDGTVVITGGLGTLGLHVARWLARGGTKHVVLTGRRGLQTPGAGEAVAELEALGARVTVSATDVSDADAVRGLLEKIPAELPLRGVVHAAGVLDDGMLSGQSADRFARVMSAKVAGACHLDALTREADLDFFVLFSSISGTLGSAGQGGYAAANTCLDALAARRCAEGLPGQSLAWGLWTDESSRATGLASGLDNMQQARIAKSGLGSVTPSRGIALLEAALARPEAQLLPVAFDLRMVARSFEGPVPPLWRELVKAVPKRTQSRRGAWARELSSLPEDRRLEAVAEVVRAEVARVLSLTAEAIEPDRPLKELGLDSLMAVELRNGLGQRAGASLPATLAFDHPTPAAIAQYLIARVLSLSPTDAPIVVTPKTARPAEQDSLRKRISRIDEFSSAELERELTESIQRVREEIGQ